MRRLVLVAVAATMGCDAPVPDLAQDIETMVAESGAEAVGVYFKNLETGDSLFLKPDTRVHAASMMKVPVMIQMYRDQEAGLRMMSDSIRVAKSFKSIVDVSTYEIGATNDSDSLIYNLLGERVPRRWLMERMITVSSNLATNILIEEVDARRTTATMRELGADSIEVLRGVEDIKAFDAGLSNSTTARDLGVIFTAIARNEAANHASCGDMIDVLSRQVFNEGIPLLLPKGIRVAHKTGSITRIRHDGGIVYLPEGGSYVLVILTRGIDDSDVADELIANISHRVYEHVAGAS